MLQDLTDGEIPGEESCHGPGAHIDQILQKVMPTFTAKVSGKRLVSLCAQGTKSEKVFMEGGKFKAALILWWILYLAHASKLVSCRPILA